MAQVLGRLCALHCRSVSRRLRPVLVRARARAGMRRTRAAHRCVCSASRFTLTVWHALGACEQGTAVLRGEDRLHFVASAATIQRARAWLLSRDCHRALRLTALAAPRAAPYSAAGGGAVVRIRGATTDGEGGDDRLCHCQLGQDRQGAEQQGDQQRDREGRVAQLGGTPSHRERLYPERDGAAPDS